MSATADLAIAIKAANHAETAAALDTVGEHASKLGESLKRVTEVAAGLVIGDVFSNLAGGLEQGIGKAESFGQAVFKLQSITGGSAESVSGMLAALGRFGIDSDQAAKSLGIFEKNLITFGDSNQKSQASAKGFAGAINDLGLNVKDADGNLLPMNDLMLQVADKFAGMDDGAQKTSDAMQLFGKSGKDLIPILDLGSAGLQEAMDTANKYGLTLTGANVDAVRQYGFAHKDMEEAMSGVTMQLGLLLMPVLAKGAELVASLAQAIAANVVPAIHSLADTLSGPAQSALDDFQSALDLINAVILAFTVDAGAMGIVYDIIRKVFGDSVADALQPFLQWFMDAIPTIKSFASDAMDQLTAALTTAGEAVQAVTQFFQDNQGASDALKTFVVILTAAFAAYEVVQGTVAIATGVWTAAQWLLNAALSANPIGVVVIALAALAAALVFAYENSEDFRNIVDKVWTDVQAVTETAIAAVQSGLATAAAAFSALGTAAQNMWQTVSSAFNSLLAGLSSLAAQAGQLAANIASAIVDGLIGGITSRAQAVASSAAAMVTGALNAAKAAVGISSPSKVFYDQVGTPIVQGLVDALDDGTQTVGDAATALANVSVTEMQLIADQATNDFAVKMHMTFDQATEWLNTFGTASGQILGHDVPAALEATDEALSVTDQQVERFAAKMHETWDVARSVLASYGDKVQQVLGDVVPSIAQQAEAFVEQYAAKTGMSWDQARQWLDQYGVAAGIILANGLPAAAALTTAALDTATAAAAGLTTTLQGIPANISTNVNITTSGGGGGGLGGGGGGGGGESHMGMRPDGSTYLISKSYGSMTDQEKDDANRYANGPGNGNTSPSHSGGSASPAPSAPSPNTPGSQNGVPTHPGQSGPGGIYNNPATGHPYAQGGIVTSPTLALIGEAGPEAVVPLGKGIGAPPIIINLNGTYLGDDVNMLRQLARLLQPHLGQVVSLQVQ